MSYLLVQHAKTKEWTHPNYEVPFTAYCKKPSVVRATRMQCEFKITDPKGKILAQGKIGDYLVEGENGWEIQTSERFEKTHDIVTKMDKTFLVTEK